MEAGETNEGEERGGGTGNGEGEDRGGVEEGGVGGDAARERERVATGGPSEM